MKGPFLKNSSQTKFIGQKRFSLEGGENTISGLDAIINLSADLGVQEVVIGMAHRGAIEYISQYFAKNVCTDL
jgi:2-oxoglutarate dehydrogenase E1 component